MMIRANINVHGIVQGVGFRPFIHKLITHYELSGFVRNTSTGAEIEVEGEEHTIEAFARDIKAKAPSLSLITSIDVSKLEGLKNYTEFKIIKSDGDSEVTTLISPDVCVCDDCLREMRAPGRRYRYPFINCTNCGPRFTIVRSIPYDRKFTSMAPFKMCPECEREYTDIEDRRYHAEPTGCNVCGPRLVFCTSDKKIISGDPIENCKQFLREGKVVAIKGLGGYHLACRFDDASIVRDLRSRKHRDEKPFAIMCRDIEVAKRYCEVSAAEARILEGIKRPIVLLKKRSDAALSEAEALGLEAVSENSRVGVMLPYTPVHFLLFEEDIEALIFTSANISDLPIEYDDREALDSLAGIADAFLLNNREIVTRCDDSVCFVYDGKEYPVRRSRGFVPYPLVMKQALPQVLACGAEQKASFCMSKGNYVIPSQHIGDMKNMETFQNYSNQIDHFKELYEITPEIIACDMHPDFLSSQYAEEMSELDGISFIRIQHHHAHMASCMADNELEGDVIGLTWDGVGYGEDGNIWGGEFLVGGYESYRRAGHLRYMNLPGGDRATKEIWRVGISLLLDSGINPVKFFDAEEVSNVKRQIQLGINMPKSSSMGRLFDGVAAILGIKHQASYEGQGAIMLEAVASEITKKSATSVGATSNPGDIFTKSYEYGIIREAGEIVLDYRPIIRAIVADKASGVAVPEIAAAFMNTLIEAAAKICTLISVDTGLDRVVMSGGTFNNMYIMDRLPRALIERHLKPFHHHRVSCGDEGLSLGQLLIATHYV